MSRIVGRGRYAGETYPRGPGGFVPAFDVASTFVFRPDGKANQNVFVDSDAMRVAVESIDLQTPKVIVVDDTLAAAHMALSAPWKANNCTFLAARPNLSTLFFDTGSIFDPSVTQITFAGNLAAQSNNTATSIFTPASAFSIIYVKDSSAVRSAEGARPFVHATVDFGFQYFVDTSSLGGFSSVTGHALTVDAGIHAFVTCIGPCDINQHALAGLGTVEYEPSVETTLRNPQDVSALATFLFGGATQVAYAAADPTKWLGTPPATVQQALDRIAANTTNAHPIP